MVRYHFPVLLVLLFSSYLASLQVDLAVTKGIDTPQPTMFAKALEEVSMKLQRANANRWNAFVSVILHEEESQEERAARPRLPSV